MPPCRRGAARASRQWQGRRRGIWRRSGWRGVRCQRTVTIASRCPPRAPRWTPCRHCPCPVRPWHWWQHSLPAARRSQLRVRHSRLPGGQHAARMPPGAPACAPIRDGGAHREGVRSAPSISRQTYSVGVIKRISLVTRTSRARSACSKAITRPSRPTSNWAERSPVERSALASSAVWWPTAAPTWRFDLGLRRPLRHSRRQVLHRFGYPGDAFPRPDRPDRPDRRAHWEVRSRPPAAALLRRLLRRLLRGHRSNPLLRLRGHPVTNNPLPISRCDEL